jgi:8-oxo-dGTP pyrophosphatase MutT (NUDIX family)
VSAGHSGGPTLIRPVLDPTILPAEPADDGLPAVPPERLQLPALRRRFLHPPPRWHVEQQSDRVLLPGVAGELRPASVLVPIIDRPGGLVVLLTLRTTHLRQHSGQVAFPGGRVEPRDPDVVHTALREAREEVGLDPGLIEVVGRMPEYTTGTGYRVTPVVGLVARDAVVVPDPGEVAAAFEVPLSFLMDPRNHERRRYDVDGVTRTFFAMPWGPPGGEPYFIWGATAAMLRNLYHFLRAD